MARKRDNSQTWFIIILCVIVFFAFVYPKLVKRVVNYTIPAEQTPIDLNDPNNDFTEEELDYYANRLTFEVNYYENADGSGIELQEIDLDYFTDASLTHQYAKSTGMQYLGNFEAYTRYGIDPSNPSPVEDFYYYDTTVSEGDVITWNGGSVATNLTRSTSLIVKIDNKPYLLQMTGIESSYWWDFLNVFTIYYNYGDLFADILQAVKTNSKGYGDYSIVVDLSNYFSIWKYDEASNQFLKERNYAKEIIVESVLKFHYYERGAQTANDSLFGQIALDRNYTNIKNTISFNANTGDGEMESIVEKQNSEVLAPACTFLKPGFTFTEWNTSADGTGTSYEVGDSITLSEDITLYAQWAQNLYAVKFYDDRTPTAQTTQYILDRTPTVLNSNTFTKAGYSFVGWIPGYLFNGHVEADYLSVDSAEIIGDGEQISINYMSYSGNLRYKIIREDNTEQAYSLMDEQCEMVFIACWKVEQASYVGTYICPQSHIRFTLGTGDNILDSFTVLGNTYDFDSYVLIDGIYENSYGIMIDFHIINICTSTIYISTNEVQVIVSEYNNIPNVLYSEIATKIS